MHYVKKKIKCEYVNMAVITENCKVACSIYQYMACKIHYFYFLWERNNKMFTKLSDSKIKYRWLIGPQSSRVSSQKRGNLFPPWRIGSLIQAKNQEVE